MMSLLTIRKGNIMKTTVFVLLIVCGALFADWIDFGFNAVDHATVTVIESTPSGMVIDIMIPGIGLTEASEDGLDFTILNVPGMTISALEPGYPQLPKVSFLAALPENPSVTFTVESMKTVEIGQLTPYPMQPIPYDNDDMPPFTYVPSAYQAGAYPDETAHCKVDGILRGVTVGRFAVNPIIWDPSTNELSVCCYIRLNIEFGGTVSVDERLYSRYFEPTYNQVLVNADILGEPQRTSHSNTSGPVYARNIREARDIDAADLLIIAGDDFVDSMMDAFVTAKWEQGYLPAVVAAGTWTYTEIQAYIQDAYDNWIIPPSFVLMVGDGPELTAYSAPTGIWSDNRFVCVDGSDYMADIYHGRFATPTDFYPNIEAKQLKWQFDPIMDYDFWNTVLCAGELELSGQTSTRWFLYTCETVHDTYEDLYGKTATRVYVKNSSASPPFYYNPGLPSNGEVVPAEITFDGTTSDIIDSINDGIFIIQHRDHGGVTGWSNPSFHTSDFTSLTNGMEAPVVFSFNCLTGQFYQNYCFAEAFARMEGGATAVIAACASSYSYFNDYMVYGCYMSFNDDFVSPPFSYTNPSGGYLAGQMMTAGKLEMQAAAPFNPYTSSGWEQYAEDEWDLFMVFGDPTMDMRTEVPEDLTVIPPATLPPGTSEALFQVSMPDRGPVAGALVCLRKDTDSLYATGLTDATGAVTLTFDPIGDLPEIDWMVTAHNALPETGIINTVGIAEGSEPVLFSAGTPFPNPGRSMNFPVTVSRAGNFELTIYDLTGRAVETLHSGELPEGSHEFLWNGTCGGSQAPAGIYMVKYSTSDGTGGIHKIVLIN